MISTVCKHLNPRSQMVMEWNEEKDFCNFTKKFVIHDDHIKNRSTFVKYFFGRFLEWLHSLMTLFNEIKILTYLISMIWPFFLIRHLFQKDRHFSEIAILAKGFVIKKRFSFDASEASNNNNKSKRRLNIFEINHAISQFYFVLSQVKTSKTS